MKKYIFFFVFIAPFAVSMTMDDAKLSTEIQVSIKRALFNSEVIKGVYLSHEKKLALTHSNTGRFRLWKLDPKTPNEAELLDSEFAPNEMEVLSVEISEESQKIWIAAKTGAARGYGIVNSQALKSIRSNLSFNTIILNQIQSKSGNFIATWDSFKRVRLWDKKGQCLDYNIASSKEGVTTLDFNEEENTVLVTGIDGRTTKHNIVNAEALIKIRSNSGAYSDIMAKKQSKSGKYIVTLDGNENVKLWDEAGEAIDYRMAQSVKKVQNIDFDEEENAVLVTHSDDSVSTFDIISKKVLSKMYAASTYCSIEQKKRCKNGMYVVSLNSDSYIELWGETGDRMKRFTLGDKNTIGKIGFRDDNKTAFIQCKDGYCFTCEIPDKQ